MRYVPTVNDNSLTRGLTASAGLHFLMFLFLVFGLPRLIPPLPAHHEPVPFEIVTIAEITNTRIGDNEESKPPPAAAAPQPKPQPVPEPEKPKPVTPPKAEEPSLQKIMEGLKKAPKTPPKTKAPEEKPAPAKQTSLASVLKDVAKMKPTQPASNASATGDAKSTQSSMGQSFSSRLTITEEDALRRQIEQCWNPPIGARDAQSLVVEVMIDVNPDRTVANAEVVDKLRYASDPFFRAAADAAIRAVHNPKCNPLELSADKYEQWKRIDFTFDPRDML